MVSVGVTLVSPAFRAYEIMSLVDSGYLLGSQLGLDDLGPSVLAAAIEAVRISLHNLPFSWYHFNHPVSCSHYSIHLLSPLTDSNPIDLRRGRLLIKH